MYEKIIEWGVKALTDGIVKRADYEQSLVLEAIKTKNALIVKRFEYAWTNCTQLLEVFVEQDAAFRDHLATWKSKQVGTPGVTKLLESIKRDLHPPFFGKVAHHRARFEATNELISSYTLAIFNALRYENIDKMVKEFAKKKSNAALSPGDVKYVYTNLLAHSLSALSAVLRVTSNDLRFWASDYIYGDISNSFAEEDIVHMCEHIVNGSADEIFLLEIEKQSGVDELWSRIDAARQGRGK